MEVTKNKEGVSILFETVQEQKLIASMLGRIQEDTYNSFGVSYNEGGKVFDYLYDVVFEGELDTDVNKIYYQKPYLFDTANTIGE